MILPNMREAQVTPLILTKKTVWLATGKKQVTSFHSKLMLLLLANKVKKTWQLRFKFLTNKPLSITYLLQVFS